MNKHVSIMHTNEGRYDVTIWRGKKWHTYFGITESTMSRLTLISWQGDSTFHLSPVGVSMWFDYPES